MVRYGAYKFKGSEINMTTFEEIHHAFFYVSSDDYGMNRAFGRESAIGCYLYNLFIHATWGVAKWAKEVQSLDS